MTADQLSKMSTNAPKILVTDFDGTMTRRDFFELARRDLPSVAERDHWQDYVEGRITHFDALARIFSSIRADWGRIEAVLDAMELDPDLPASLSALQETGWRVIVASAGCRWYIDQLLQRAHIELEVHANPGTFSPETGLALQRPVDSPFYRHETGIDKSAIMRAALAEDPQAVFAGDGRPDLDPAMLVQPARRFATGWLAEHFTQTGGPFHPFDRWSQIAGHLLEST